MNIPLLFTPIYLTVDEIFELGVFRADLKRFAPLEDGLKAVLWVALGSECRITATYGELLRTRRGWTW